MFVLLGLAALMSRTFYFDPAGHDSANGLSQKSAWQSLSKLTGVQLHAGDSVVLKSGAQFTGSISLTPDEFGAVNSPITIRSSGSKPATIVSSEKPAISAHGGGLVIQDLKLIGKATKSAKDHDGIRLIAQGPQTKNVIIQRVDVSGFGANGVVIGAAQDVGFTKVVLRQINAHDNYDSGIATWDGASHLGKPCRNHSLLITNCQANRNRGGSGIVISGFDGGVIENCVASGNRGAGGGVGIWAWSTKNVLFQNCIAAGTVSAKGDGGGFDLDGGCEDCAIFGCLSYRNSGPGYMHCDYPGAPATKNNFMRGCLSVNDGRKPKGDSIGLGFVCWGSGLDNCAIVDNTMICTEASHAPGPFGMLFASFIDGSQAKTDTPHITGCVARNNRIIVTAPGVALVHFDPKSSDPGDILARDNRYETTRPLFAAWSKTFDSLGAWQEAGQDTGSAVQPSQPVDPSEFEITDPGKLPALLAKWLPKRSKGIH